MADNKDTLPDYFNDDEEAGKFWDTHSISDYWDDTEEVDMEFEIQERIHFIPIDDAKYKIIKEKAKTQHKSVEGFINTLIDKELSTSV